MSRPLPGGHARGGHGGSRPAALERHREALHQRELGRFAIQHSLERERTEGRCAPRQRTQLAVAQFTEAISEARQR